MKEAIRYTIIAGCLGLSYFPGELLAQNGSGVAVMEVRAEVVPGASVLLAESVPTFDPVQSDSVYAEFHLILPEGVEFVHSADSTIRMEGGEKTWNLGNRVLVEEKESGVFRFRFYSRVHEDISNGTYKGIQTATIEYL